MHVIIKNVKGKGKGMFATKDFVKEEQILMITGEVIRTKDPVSYPDFIQEHWAPIGREGDECLFISPEEPWMYMNHSCDCNAGVVNDRTLIACKDIKQGEEITADYSSFDIELLMRGKKQLPTECRCGSKQCRKIIKTYDQLDKEDQERLEPFLNAFMKEKYFEDIAQ